MDWDIINESIPAIFSALPVTLALVSVSLFFGFFLAVIVALGRLSTHAALNKPAYVFVYIFRSTPLLIQMFLIYYGSGQFRAELDAIGLWQFFKDPWFCAILSLTLNTAAYTSEIIRGGIQSVAAGLLEAGKACGMSTLQLFRRITFPLAMRQALPGYGNEVILMVKSTSLASTITIMDMTGVYKEIASDHFSPFEPIIVAGRFFLIFNYIVTLAISRAEKKLAIQAH
ncbi:MAG: ABC transporter, membrane spanning protein (nopaline) [Osedax symbiont Rs2]|nr:MAG: ABC transporter, membrane spanning protein (nopaline) [Osedax symbiont Rs2]